MSAAHHDQVLVDLDYQVATLTRGCMRAWADERRARRRGDWAEVERLQDLADTLSAAADDAQTRLDIEVKQRVAASTLGGVLVLKHGRYVRVTPP